MKVRLKKIRFKIGDEQAVLLKCMGIALVFWVFVKLSQTYQTILPVHLEYQLPAGKDFAQQPVATLNTTFSSDGWKLLLSSLSRPNPSIKFDLSEYPRQEIPKEELVRKIKEVSTLDLIDIDRNQIYFELDTTSVRKVPVVFDGNLKFATDFFVKDSIRLTPDSVLIWGSSSALRGINFLKTTPLTINGIRADVSKRLTLQLPSKQNINLTNRTVEVFIPVEQFSEKEFTVPIQIKDGADSIQLVPALAKVICTLGMSRYEQTTANDFIIEASIGNGPLHLLQNSVALTMVKSPSWAKNVQISPKAVEYFIIR